MYSPIETQCTILQSKFRFVISSRITGAVWVDDPEFSVRPYNRIRLYALLWENEPIMFAVIDRYCQIILHHRTEVFLGSIPFTFAGKAGII